MAKQTIFTDVFKMIELDTDFLGKMANKKYLTFEGVELMAKFIKERTKFLNKKANVSGSDKTEKKGCGKLFNHPTLGAIECGWSNEFCEDCSEAKDEN